MEFFRHCPGCGRRFHIKLESKKLVSSHEESIRRLEPEAERVRGGVGTGSPAMSAPSIMPVTVHEGKPLIFDVEEFQYAYKCGHCGHEWSERHFQEHRVA